MSLVRDQLRAFRQRWDGRGGGVAARAEKAQKRAAAKAHHAALKGQPEDIGPSGRPVRDRGR
jgi:hypothetical protein